MTLRVTKENSTNYLTKREKLPKKNTLRYQQTTFQTVNYSFHYLLKNYNYGSQVIRLHYISFSFHQDCNYSRNILVDTFNGFPWYDTKMKTRNEQMGEVAKNVHKLYI